MKILLLLFFSCISCAGISQLKLSDVPDSLLKGANAIVREEVARVQVKSASDAVVSYRRLITVLNESAKDELYFEEYTDRFKTIPEFSATLYNAQGNKVAFYTRKDLVIYKYDENVVGDGKRYLLNIPATSYPVHLEVEYQKVYKGLLHLPPYYVGEHKTPVLSSLYEISVPSSLDIRHKSLNTSLQPVITNIKDRKIYTWSVKNIPGLDIETRSPVSQAYPVVLTAPNKFELDGNPGNMSTWEAFGKWYGDLAKNAIDLSPERISFLQELVKNTSTDKEKASIIYDYLQKNFRYVSIQLGIGGWKPFAASFVDKMKYGDCKALSNYTQACLKAVGVNSYQALIFSSPAGSIVSHDFPINAFNHVVLAIPNSNDTTWLECTSNTNEFGVLGTTTENRHALLITEEGGKLVPTPKSNPTNNSVAIHSIVELQENGNAIVRSSIRTRGEYRLFESEKISVDDKQKFLTNGLGFQKPELFELKEIASDNVYQHLSVLSEYEKLPAVKAGSKLFLHPRFMNVLRFSIPDIKERKNDFYLDMPFTKSDTTVYILPEGYMVDKLPSPVDHSSEFGSLKVDFRYDENARKLTTITFFSLAKPIIPARSYAAAKEFFDKVNAEYSSKIVVKKA